MVAAGLERREEESVTDSEEASGEEDVCHLKGRPSG